MTPRVGIDVRKVPADIRQRVDAEAAVEGVSRNDVIVRVLSARYGVPYEPTGYPYTPDGGDSAQWGLRVPVMLREVIRAHALSVGGTQPGVILLALADHYGLPVQSPRKRGSRSLSPAIVREAQRRNQAGESIRSLAREYGVKRETLTAAMNRHEEAAA
jgi:hypothetical protein